MEISSTEPEHAEPPLLELAETEVPGAAGGLLEEITIEAEIANDFTLSDGEERDGDRGSEESPIPLDGELQADFFATDEPIPLVSIEPPDLSSALPEEGIASSSEPASGGSVAQDASELEGILYGFKESLDQQLDKEDAETHYNLGIAYMEMALQDDAIKQFRIAANDPSRELDCLTLQGVCCREKGDFAGSEQVLTSVLSLGDLRADRVMNLQYELGLLYTAAGREEEALQAFRDVFVANPGFRDTMKMIKKLSRKAGSFDLSDMGDVEIELEELD
jgi:tetratricopeptide (TPR) repeat protein